MPAHYYLPLPAARTHVAVRTGLPTASISLLLPLRIAVCRLCTFDRTVDTQISAFIHRDGWWNANKRDLLQRLMPRVNEMMDMPEVGG